MRYTKQQKWNISEDTRSFASPIYDNLTTSMLIYLSLLILLSISAYADTIFNNTIDCTNKGYVFCDTFNGTTVNTDMWKQPTAGGVNACTVIGGMMTCYDVTSGDTASSLEWNPAYENLTTAKPFCIDYVVNYSQTTATEIQYIGFGQSGYNSADDFMEVNQGSTTGGFQVCTSGDNGCTSLCNMDSGQRRHIQMCYFGSSKLISAQCYAVGNDTLFGSVNKTRTNAMNTNSGYWSLNWQGENSYDYMVVWNGTIDNAPYLSAPASPSQSNFSFNVTDYQYLLSSPTAWNSNGIINLSSNLLTFTFNTSLPTNASCSLFNFNNYSRAVANNSNYKVINTMSTSFSVTLFDNLTTNQNQCVYCQYYDGTINSQSGCLKTIYTPAVNTTRQSPSSPTIITPVNKTYKGNMNISWVNSSVSSPSDTRLQFYNISLWQGNTFIQNIILLNSTTTTTTTSNISGYNFSIQPNVFYAYEEGSGSIVNDSSGNAINLVNTGAYSYVSSKGSNNTGNYAISYNGVNAYSWQANNPLFDITNTSTIALWIKPNMANINGTYIFVSKAGSGIFQYFFGTTNNNLYFTFRTTAHTSRIITSNLSLVNNTWNFVAMTINTQGSYNNYSIYHNLEYYSIVSTERVATSVGDFAVGRDSYTAGWYTNGLFDNVMIINRSLSNAEMASAYQNSIYSGNVNSSSSSSSNSSDLPTSYLWDTNPIAEGYYNIRVSVSDNYSMTNYSVSQTFGIDRTAPVCTSLGSSGTLEGTNISITATLTDAFNINQTVFWNNISSPSVHTASSNPFYETDYLLLPSANTSIIYGYNFSDNLNNAGSCTNTLSVTSVPVIPPVNQTTQLLEFGVCPSTTPQLIFILSVFVFAVLLIIFGVFGASVIGIFGGLVLIIIAFSITACNGLIGIIMWVVAILIMIGFVMKMVGGK